MKAFKKNQYSVKGLAQEVDQYPPKELQDVHRESEAHANKVHRYFVQNIKNKPKVIASTCN